MNKWRIIIIVILVASLALMAGASVFHWNPWAHLTANNNFHPARPFPVMRTNTPALVRIPASLLATFLCSMVFLYLFPRQIFRISRAFTVSTEILRQVLLGFLFFILVGIVAISASLSVFTAPLSAGLLILAFLSSFMGISALCLTLGGWFLERAGWTGYPFPLAVGLGLVVLFAVFNLPFVGIFFLIVIACAGFGVTIWSHFGTNQSWNIESSIEEEKK